MGWGLGFGEGGIREGGQCKICAGKSNALLRGVNRCGVNITLINSECIYCFWENGGLSKKEEVVWRVGG